MPGEGPVYPVADAEEEEYEVEQILQMRLNRNRPEFLVKWKGYSTMEATWEPEHNLVNAPTLLASFKKSLEAGTASSRRRGNVRK